MVCWWEQGILGYHLAIVHISNKIMVNIDPITQCFRHIFIHYIDIAALISFQKRAKYPRTYATTKFSNLGNVKIIETDNSSRDPPPVLTSDVFHRFSQDSTTNSAKDPSLEPS